MLDVVVVGAGVIGLAIARELDQRGARVALVERNDEPGRESSWAAAGMLAPSAEAQYGEEAGVELGRLAVARYPGWVRSLQEETGLDLDFADADSQGSTLLVAADRDDAAVLRHTMVYQQQLGLPVEWLTPTRARKLEPWLGPRIAGAILSPLDARVDNRKLVEALVASVRRREGVELVLGHRAALCVEAGRCHGVELDDGTRIAARATVVSAGAWSAQLDGLPDAARLPVRPVRGQALSVRFEQGIALHHTIRTPHIYMVPRRDGRLIVGATSEDKGFDKRLTAGGIFQLLDRAREVFPAIDELPLLETWAGLRPGCRDNLPIVGPTSTAGLWLATGHYRNGILMAGVTAQMIASRVFGDDAGSATVHVDLAPFSPARFGL